MAAWGLRTNVDWLFEAEMMNRISITDLAKMGLLDPLVEKEVQVRAYELYERRGKKPGFALQDWLEAEAEVFARLRQ